ncbi:MAG: bifunctional folylpolyglutamate synthase/dihydrofolate synthase [Bacteroidales bacterium]|jgi:dihydrofolate synthase/folylpolyglutamate synthase
MNYNQTIDFLYKSLPVYHRIGQAAYKANLNNTIMLDDYFKHPHERFKTIHVAGTNGKGSVSHMLASILQEAGIKTALFTSPHIKDFRERIRINGEMITEEAVVAFVADHTEIITTLKPSFFELSTAMAFDWFARNDVEVAVVETGLGGRLDSTNIIVPLLSVITNIGLEHTNLLGDTYEKIAFEKAGIIKKHVPVLIGESRSDTDPVFIDRAESEGSQIVFADKNFEAKWVGSGFGELSVGDGGITTIRRKYRIDRAGYSPTKSQLYSDDPNNIGTSGSGQFPTGPENDIIPSVIEGKTPLCGDYQLKNLATLAQAFELLEGQLGLTDRDFVAGVANVIRNTGLMGRWQVLGTRPLTICDAGHNYHGIVDIVGQLKALGKKTSWILGFSNDKDINSILFLFPVDGRYYFTGAGTERAMDPFKLAQTARGFGIYGDAYGTVAEAYNAARNDSADDDLIFIGGSIYVIAEII